MPPLIYPEWSYKSAPDYMETCGHPEIALLRDRLEFILENTEPLSEREVGVIMTIQAVLPVVLGPMAESIREHFPAEFLLPIDGRWRTLAQYLAGFRDRYDHETIADAIRWVHTATISVELAEAKIASWQADIERRWASL